MAHAHARVVADRPSGVLHLGEEGLVFHHQLPLVPRQLAQLGVGMLYAAEAHVQRRVRLCAVAVLMNRADLLLSEKWCVNYTYAVRPKPPTRTTAVLLTASPTRANHRQSSHAQYVRCDTQTHASRHTTHCVI